MVTSELARLLLRCELCTISDYFRLEEEAMYDLPLALKLGRSFQTILLVPCLAHL